jgi:hypothetical protein
MRKAKFVLGAVVALGIVGAVFAFKARQQDTLYIRTLGTTTCGVPVPGVTLTTAPNPATTYLATFITTTPGVCATSTVYYPGQ